MASELAEFFRQLETAGYVIRTGGSGHWKIYNPRGAYVATAPRTSKSRRTMANLKATIRRAEQRGRQAAAR